MNTQVLAAQVTGAQMVGAQLSGAGLQPSAGDFGLIAPLLIIGALAFVVLLWDTLLKPANKGILLVMSLLGVVVAGALTWNAWAELGSTSHTLFSGRLVVDRFALFFNVIILTVTGLVLLISRDFLEREEIHVGEYYSLLMFAVFGMMLLAMSADLIMMFVAIEVMSISVYVLAAFNRGNYRSIEGALKYFILGSFASGFLLYGIALLFGHTGTTQLAGITASLMKGGYSPLLTMGMGLLLVGFGFKVGAVPFHMWVPDVYEGSMSPVTAAMATGVKAAAFAALIRTMVALAPAVSLIEPVIAIIAALTIVVGNIAAIRQDNLKRMLAYSGVAHTGYMFAGLLAIQPGGGLTQAAVSSLAFYLAAYIFMNIGAFAVIILMGRRNDEPVLATDWAGLGFKYPVLGAALTLFMLSMGGLPPTAGFFAKFYLFSSILDAGFTWLVILAVLTSAASFFYYLRVVVQMYMHESESTWAPQASSLATVAIALAAFATILLGILPSGPISVLQWARESVIAMM